ncbi:thermonuclease family protein [Mesotoga sp. B105.6.4]|uniref:thermonuclease family protein n=1 Tax=Mesotoga sp. B105.6.4 TaxID=1582224 RepID=UPI000CCC52FA|nr:thermonuclease family protein [Mesotoga sp. B105.6.4]
MKGLTLFLLFVLGVLSFSITPISIQLGDVSAYYAQEYLCLFDEVSDFTEAEIALITDSDTISVLRSKSLNFAESVRLIGLEVPKIIDSSDPDGSLSNTASDFAREVLVDKKILLSYDSDPVDEFGRILAYVWIPVEYQGETRYILFNLLAIINGYGNACTTCAFDESYMTIFAEAETLARDNSLCIWGEDSSVVEAQREGSAPTYDPIVYITDTGTKYHRDGCRYLSESVVAIRLSEAIRRGYEPCSVCKP